MITQVTPEAKQKGQTDSTKDNRDDVTCAHPTAIIITWPGRRSEVCKRIRRNITPNHYRTWICEITCNKSKLLDILFITPKITTRRNQ
jgi:hypothetical protein